jgi:hypothetical protein
MQAIGKRKNISYDCAKDCFSLCPAKCIARLISLEGEEAELASQLETLE